MRSDGKRDRAVKLLLELGLSEYDARAFVALVASHPAGAYATAQAAGVPTSKIYQTMDRLERRGMVARVASRDSRATLYRPVPSQRFARDAVAHYARLGAAVGSALRQIEQTPDDQLIWNLDGWDETLARARAAIDESRDTLLVSGWPEELSQIDAETRAAHGRGVRVAVVHFGEPQGAWPYPVYTHRQEEIVARQHGGRTLCLAADQSSALIAHIPADGAATGGFSTHRSFVDVAEDFIRHDVYFLKVMRRMGPQLMARFGEDLQLLRDPFTDREYTGRAGVDGLEKAASSKPPAPRRAIRRARHGSRS